MGTLGTSALPPANSNRLDTDANMGGLSPYRRDGDLLKLEAQAAMVDHVVPQELYLRELEEIDLDDDEAILRFTNQFGRLGHPHTRVLRLADEIGPTRSREIIRLLGVDVPDDRDLPWEAWWAECDAVLSERSLGPFEKAIFESDGLQHIDTFRGWALAFRLMSRTYRKYLDQRVNESELERLTIVVSALVSIFSPVVMVGAREGMPFDALTDEYYPRLENVLALQLFNHIAAGDTYHICANETHRGVFVHQRGRATRGQYRTEGVMYCSAACARAAASRGYRRRKKSEGEES